MVSRAFCYWSTPVLQATVLLRTWSSVYSIKSILINYLEFTGIERISPGFIDVLRGLSACQVLPTVMIIEHRQPH